MAIRYLAFLCVLLLTACSPALYELGDTLSLFRGGTDSAIGSAKLDPRYRYLRITVGGKATLMILGYVDPGPQGPVEVWYSSGGEVLRIQGGRIVGATGMPTDWLNVRLSAQPAWSGIAAPVALTRQRDVMPGYDYGIVDALSVAPVVAPSDTRLVGVPTVQLRWFEETSTGRQPLPRARYAVSIQDGQEIVVYGEQCLSKTFCLSWQRWPANT